MAETAQSPAPVVRSAGLKIAPVAQPAAQPTSATQPIPVPAPNRPDRSTLTVMSPVNQNGSFEFDRVIKSGTVVKRTRKTKQWKPIYLVLRPNLLSIYRNENETKLRHQINLADLTAVARQKDSKKKVDHVFGLFSPARNYHLAAHSEKDAHEWVDLIRTEARIDDDDRDDDMVVQSPAGSRTLFSGFGRLPQRDQIASSSSETDAARPKSSLPHHNPRMTRRPSHALDYSGNERGSFSDFSDTAAMPFHASMTSLPYSSHQHRHQHQSQHPNPSQISNLGTTPDDERVIYHGWLYVLKSKGGVRQWKKVWVVLRPKALGLYKNEEEYRANLIIPFSSIIDAVDIDPLSKSKKYCMQVISEDKSFRFCASDENSLSKWLGAFKSLLVKRRDAQQPRVLKTVPNAGNAPHPASRPHTSSHPPPPKLPPPATITT